MADTVVPEHAGWFFGIWRQTFGDKGAELIKRYHERRRRRERQERRG